MRCLRLTVAVMLLAASAFAAEAAELRNGFVIAHRSRELRGETVRLYLDDQRKSFLDIPQAEIVGYTSEPDPPQVTSTSNSAAPSAAPAKDTRVIVAEASQKHGVDSDFIRSVIQQESAGNSRAVSSAGARGLMQLMPGTATQLGVQDSFNPEQNVHGGTEYLRVLLERYDGDAIKALAAYNAGPAAVDRYRGVPPYRETRAYVSRIVHEYNRSKASAATAASTTKAAHKASAKTTQAAMHRDLRKSSASPKPAAKRSGSKAPPQSSKIETASAYHRLPLATTLTR